MVSRCDQTMLPVPSSSGRTPGDYVTKALLVFKSPEESSGVLLSLLKSTKKAAILTGRGVGVLN